MAFTFPLLWIVSYMGLYHFLKKQDHSPSLEIAYLFGIIGAALTLLIINIILQNYSLILPIVFIFSVIIYWVHVRLIYTPSYITVVIFIALFLNLFSLVDYTFQSLR